MNHRGPDDRGHFFDASIGVGLCHQRLSILDLSTNGHQPMFDRSGKVTIVFNGEIYNFSALKADLKTKNYTFKSSSDTEVLLYLYLEHGTDMLKLLNGIFSFAIWDARDQFIFVARDQAGVKPLYYTLTENGFAFASELKSLLVLPDVDRDIDIEAACNHLTFLWSPGERTMIKAIKKLLPGHAMIIRNGRISRNWQYYDLPNGRLSPKVKGYGEAIEAIKSGLQSAVRSQLVADVPVGAFLSGGLDSSAIAVMAKKINPGLDLQCFTINLDAHEMGHDGFSNDLPYAKRVAKHIGVPLTVVEVDASIIQQLPKMIFHLDEPQADPAPLNVMMISKIARERGMRVLLSGTGGDDLFSGYRRHYALGQERYWSFLPGFMRTCIARVARSLPNSSPYLRRVSKAFEYADLEEIERIAGYFAWLKPSIVHSLFHKDYRAKLDGFSPLLDLSNSLLSVAKSSSPLEKMLYLEGKHFLADHNLNYTDKMGMAEGVEIRVPFLDLDLIDIAARVPDHMKQHGRTGKWILKKAMEGYLPKDVIYRPKTGFGAPLRYWMKNQLKPIMEDLLSKESVTSRGIFDYKRLSQLIDADSKGFRDYSYPIFAVMNIELWCRTFIDPAVPQIYTTNLV